MIINDVLVKFDGGYVKVTHDGSIALFGHKQGSLQLGGVGTVGAARFIGELYLKTAALPAIAPDVAYLPANIGEVPYFGFRVGDRVTAPDPSGPTPQPARVQSVTVSEDTEGNPVFGVELRTRLQDASDRISRIIRKAGDQGKGIYESARTATVTPPTLPTPRSPEWPPFNYVGPVKTSASVSYTVPWAGRVTSLLVTARVPGVEVGFEFTKTGFGGGIFASGRLEAGSTRVLLFANRDFVVGDQLSAAVTYVSGAPETAPIDLLIQPKVSS